MWSFQSDSHGSQGPIAINECRKLDIKSLLVDTWTSQTPRIRW